MSKCKHPIEVEVSASSHDIHIRDTKHSDNSVTMTKDEARYAIEQMQKYL